MWLLVAQIVSSSNIGSDENSCLLAYVINHAALRALRAACSTNWQQFQCILGVLLCYLHLCLNVLLRTVYVLLC